MPTRVPFASLAAVAIRAGEHQISQGHVGLRFAPSGAIEHPRHGLFALETRMLSRWRWGIEGRKVHAIASSPVEQHAWLGYLGATAPPVPEDRALTDGIDDPLSGHTLEIRISRVVGANMHEHVTFTNWSRAISRFEVVLEVGADFAAQVQAFKGQPAFGQVTPRWTPADDGGVLQLDWHAERTWSHQGQVGHTRLDRWTRVRLRGAPGPVRWERGALRFTLELPPGGRWQVCAEVDLAGISDDPTLETERYPCHVLDTDPAVWDRRDDPGFRDAASFEDPHGSGLTPVVLGTLERARLDLASLRMTENGSWTVAAGAPLYLTLFGRDTLTVVWQAAMLDPEPIVGTLEVLAKWQGEKVDPWRDEEPGKMLHERHLGPASLLHARPQAAYYGSITTAAFYPVTVGQAWHWLGDLERVVPFVEPALAALNWLDTYARRDDGFYIYRTRSAQGVRHQAWKDSPAAIVRGDGSDVAPPVATCEEQGFVHLAKLQLAELLWWLDRPADARRLVREAAELRARFNDAFWMDDEAYYATALDADGAQVDAVASNPGHCVACGLVPKSRVGAVVGRLLSPDLFSGWGVRTLSSDNPAYNPFAYHRGSVWPVENGTFVLGCMLAGMHRHASLLAKAMFEAAALFPSLRLPEAFSGHPRDHAHPFPAIYPDANAPQAWSASAVVCAIQGLLGLYPYAPLHLLLVDPHLPPWLPRLRLRDLRVGDARVTLSFERDPRGRTRFEVEDLRGVLRVVRQPSPFSLTAGPLERARDLLESLRANA